MQRKNVLDAGAGPQAVTPGRTGGPDEACVYLDDDVALGEASKTTVPVEEIKEGGKPLLRDSSYLT